MKTILLSGGWEGLFEMMVVFFMGSVGLFIALISLLLIGIDKYKGLPTSPKKRKVAIYGFVFTAISIVLIFILRAIYTN